MCVGVRPGQANAHQEKLYNLGDSAPGGHVGLIKLIQKWCESRHRVLVAVMFDGIKKEQNTVWTLLEESISKGKGTLTAGIDYYHQLKSNRNACVFLGTAPPAGGHCIVDIGILLTHLPVDVVLMTNEYSDDLAAAAVSPAAFHAIAASSEPMWARYGTALFLLAMKTWQMAIDDRNRDSLARVRCWFIWFGLFVLTSFSLHTDTLRNNTAFALAALIVVCRECDSVTQPWRVTTRMQEGYHGEIRTASHMTEVSVAQLYDIVQAMNIVHANCRANGWEAWRATASGSSISGAAARLLDLALPLQAAMSEEAIIEQGRSAALVAEKLLTVGGWREDQMSDWISVVRCAKSFKDFLPAVAKWKRQALHMSEDVDENLACGPQPSKSGERKSRIAAAGVAVAVSASNPSRLESLSASAAEEDLPLIALVGKSCAYAAGEQDPVEVALKSMREAAREKTQVPSDEVNVAWESPSGQPDVSAALEGLAKLRTKGPYIAQEALQAMLALGFIKPKLPKRHGQNVDASVLQLF